MSSSEQRGGFSFSSYHISCCLCLSAIYPVVLHIIDFRSILHFHHDFYNELHNIITIAISMSCTLPHLFCNSISRAPLSSAGYFRFVSFRTEVDRRQKSVTEATRFRQLPAHQYGDEDDKTFGFYQFRDFQLSVSLADSVGSVKGPSGTHTRIGSIRCRKESSQSQISSFVPEVVNMKEHSEDLPPSYYQPSGFTKLNEQDNFSCHMPWMRVITQFANKSVSLIELCHQWNHP